MREQLYWLGRCVAAAFLASACSLVPTAEAQVLYGSVVGAVQDPSGAVVPNAQVTITNRETGQTREGNTDAQGNYTINSVLPGRYDVKVSSAGFRTLSRENVEVSAGTVARADFKMEVGQVSEQVTVAASAVQLQTDRSDTSTTITTKPIQTLPLNLYRNYQALVNLVPGATPAGYQNSATDTPASSLTTNVNGTPRNMNTTRLDGAVNVNIWLPHHTMYVAPSEAVQEVNVSTSSFEAEQGSAGGAAITVITQSGTNELRGAAWEYHNNQHLRARNYFMRPQDTKPRDTMNIFGAKLGGPIVQNKLFYFGHFEATRQRTGGFGIFDVPTAAIRNGDFSQAIVSGASAVTPIYDPLTGNANGTGRTQFAGNVIPPNRISPIARRILERIPAPNREGAVQNYSIGATGIFDRNNYDYKVNYNRNDKHMIWGKSSFLVADVTGVAAFGEIVGPAVVQDPGTGHTFTQTHAIGHTYTFTPNFLMDQVLGFTRQSQTVFGEDYGTNWGTEIFGIPGTNGPDERQSGMPTFAFGYSTIGQGATWMPLFRVEQSYTHDTNLNWVRGAHDLRFGFNLVRHHLNHWQPEIENPRGGFTFGGGVTALSGGAAPNFYNQAAAFLLGMPTTIAKSLQFEEMTGREWQLGWYFRDRWQASRKLTLTLGVRLDYYPLMTRRNTGLERLDPETMLVYLGGRGNQPMNAGISINNPLWAPRVGFAYRMTDSTVIRSGYGLTWDPLPFSRPLRGFYPLTIAQSNVAPNDFTSSGTLATGIPAFQLPDVSTGVIPLPPSVDMRSPWSTINRGYIQSWNFTIERQLPGNMVTSVAYVGTQVTHQLADRDINAAMPGLGNAGRPYAARFNRLRDIKMWDGWLSSNYHSMQVALNRQFTNGLLLKGAYTWSKAINMADDNGWVGVNWNSPEVIYRNRARAGYDRRHVFQMAYVYELPFGKGKRFAQEGPLSWIIGGWGLNGVIYAFTGTPMTVSSNVACNCPGNLQTAEQLKSEVDIFGRVGPGEKWFDTAAFGRGPQNAFGSSGRNILSGPGRGGMDMRLSRIFPIGERFRFEFMGEAFNITNSPWFSNPSTNVDAATYGEIRSTVTQSGRGVSDRQFRLGARLQF
jgi:hypothetical protein